MSNGFAYLFTPLQIGKIEVKNRFVFLPHATGFVSSDGLPEERQLRYLEERARGGVGLIIEAGPAVHETSQAFAVANGWDERIVPILERIASAVHKQGAKIFSQPHCAGAEMPASHTGQSGWAPSDVPDPFGMNEIPKPMEYEDIAELITRYVTIAKRVQCAGYDGLELKACHNGLLREFLSPANNFRQDEYGGSLENRMRLILDLLTALREAVGSQFVLGVRACLDEFKPGGYTVDDGLEICRILAETGLIDYMSADVGTMKTSAHLCGPPMSLPLSCNVWSAAALRDAVDLPVIAAGRINDPIQAEKILVDGHADLIGMARQLLCDPETPNKAREGRLDDIRHCMACNQGCFGGLYNPNVRHVGCVQNPSAGHEHEQSLHPFSPTTNQKAVVIVGGGPAGMKAAETAARRGHRVTLYEKNHETGGQVRIAAKAPHHAEFEEVTHWLTIQIKKLGVTVKTGVEATPDLVLAEQPDAVVVATGASFFKPLYIEGTNQNNVITVEDVHQGLIPVGDNVLIFADWRGFAAIGAAEILLEHDKTVEIVSPMLFIGQDIDPLSLAPTYQHLLEKGTVLTSQTALIGIEDTTVTLLNIFTQQTDMREEIDAVVLSTPAKANDRLYYALKGKVRELYRIGDCVAPRKVDAAIGEGQKAGLLL